MNALAVADSSLLADDSGLVRRFLAWLPQAFPHERAEAVNALARAYLHSPLAPEARADAELALTRALDDPEPRVRRALAEAFASARQAPRHIVLALAADVSEVSRAVLLQSPLLGDADLVDCVGVGDAAAQAAIARRARLSPAVAAALAEIGERPAAMALIGNHAADLGRPTLWRLFERFGADVGFRERLVERPGLPAALRAAIAAATAEDMSNFASDGRWLDPRRAQRIGRCGCEQAFVAIAANASGDELAELVGWLRGAGRLTVALFMRAFACGDTTLFRQAMAEMAGLPPARVAGLINDPHGQGFAALYARAGLPPHLLPAFRIAVACAGAAGVAGVGVHYALTTRILRAIEAREDAALEPVASMLWRLAGEGARADARDFEAQALAPEPVLVEAIEDQSAAPPVLMLNIEPGNENFAPPLTLDLAAETPETIAA